MTYSLEQIIKCLAKNKQRATYKAVADVLGLDVRWVMTSRKPSYADSWVVTKETGLPSEKRYDAVQIDPDVLTQKGSVIEDADELLAFLWTRI